MAHGYGLPYHKRATQDNFDGSTTAKTLWLKGSAVCNLLISAGLNVDAAGVARGYLLAKLEYFSGAVWTGSAWSGGAWTEMWSGDIALYAGATATKDSNAPQVHQVNFSAPMLVPAPYQGQIMDPTVSGGGISYITPNTHTAAPVATETDLRLYVTLVAGNATASGISISATVVMAE